jgi:hypothetical protein
VRQLLLLSNVVFVHCRVQKRRLCQGLVAVVLCGFMLLIFISHHSVRITSTTDMEKEMSTSFQLSSYSDSTTRLLRMESVDAAGHWEWMVDPRQSASPVRQRVNNKRQRKNKKDEMLSKVHEPNNSTVSCS